MQPLGHRAQAHGIIAFFAMLVIAGVTYALFNPVLDAITTFATNTTTNQTTQGIIDTRTQIWNRLLFFSLFACGLFIIARSVFQSRRP